MEKIYSSFDLFAEPLLFTFKKNTHFRTMWGGFVSLFTITSVMLLSFYMSRSVFFKENIYVGDFKMKESIPKNMSFITDKTFNELNKITKKPENGEEEIFYNSIKINNVKKGYPMIFEDFKKYIDIDFNQIKIINGKTYKNSLKYEKCKKFSIFDAKTINEKNLTNTYCLNDNYTLGGNYLMDQSNHIEINIRKCNNEIAKKAGYDCLPEKDIDNFLLENIQIEWYYEENYVNLTSIENYKLETIKYKYFELNPTFMTYAAFSVIKNVFNLFDSFFYPFTEPLIEFRSINIEQFHEDLIDINEENILLKIVLIPSREHSRFERKHDSIFVKLASIGGSLDVLYGIGFILVFIFVKENFNEAMIQEFYDLNDANDEDLVKQNFDDIIRNIYNYHRDNSFNEYMREYLTDFKDNGFNHSPNPKYRNEGKFIK